MAEIISINNAEQARKEIEDLQNVLKHPGWALYQRLVEQHATAIGTQILAPQNPIREWQAGYMRGLDDAISLPNKVLQAYDEKAKQEPGQVDNPPATGLPESPYPMEGD